MKKMTLAATLLAVFMIGCSDMGVDNSVASTSEAKNQQVKAVTNEPLILARSATGFYRDERLTGGNYGGNHNGYERYSYMSEVGIEVQMQSYFDGVNAIGAYHVMNAPYYPDFIRVMTVPFYNCRIDNRNVAYCDFPSRSNPSRNMKVETVAATNNVMAVTDEEGFAQSSWAQPELLGVISSFSAVWNSGRSDEIILSAATYNGTRLQSNYRLARALYEQYFLPAVNEYWNTHSN